MARAQAPPQKYSLRRRVASGMFPARIVSTPARRSALAEPKGVMPVPRITLASSFKAFYSTSPA